MSASSSVSASSSSSLYHSFLEEEALTRAVRGARDCSHPASSLAWELFCRCRCGWQGDRLMIAPAHL